MSGICTITRRILLCGILCLSLSGRAQEVRTKSGTSVSAVPREQAVFLPAKTSAADVTAGTYLVLSPPGWRGVLEPLLQWKREQGFRVEWMAAEVRQRDTLRARLKARYDAGSPLRPSQRYVLLVGDVDRIQSFVGRHTPAGLSASVTDLYYGEYTGDYLPETAVGRLSVADSLELAVVVGKIVNYERGLSPFPADRCLLVAGREDRSPAPTTTNGQVNYLERLSLRRTPSLAPSAFHNADTATARGLMPLLHRPYAFVNYTGHGLRSGWSNPVLTAPMVDTLSGFAPAVMVNNCCLTNAFDAICFGEQMLRSPRGAVGLIGATNETLWNEDFYWAVGAKYPPVLMPPGSGAPGAFDTLLSSPSHPCDADALTLGRMLYDGCRAVTLSGSAYDAFYWETYCLLGDPSMVPVLGVQDSLWVVMDTTPVAGDVSLSATTLPFSRVSVTDDSILLGTAVADSTGRVFIPLAVALAADSVKVTAVRPQGRPCCCRMLPARPADTRLAVTGYRVADTLLRVKVANVGLQPDAEAFVVLDAEGCSDTIFLSSLPSGAVAEALFPLRDEWRGRAVEGILMACAGTSCTSLPVTFEVRTACPQVASLAVMTADSLPVSFLLPDRDYLLAVTFSLPVDTAEAMVGGHRTTCVGQQTFTIPIRLDADLRVEVFLSYLSPCGPQEEHFWLQGFRAVETFEDGTIDSYPWQTSTAYPWQSDSRAFEGNYALRSAPLPDGMKSTLAIAVEVLMPDSVSFRYNVSSEASDWLNFYVDGRKVGYWSGATGWRRYAWPLSAGRHLLEWHYVKDGSVSERDDCARIDNVVFPLCRWETPCGTPLVDSTLLSIIPPNPPLSLFPNPTSGDITVHYPGTARLTVVDAMGRPVDSFTVHGQTVHSLRHLPAGVYWLIPPAGTPSPQIHKIILLK